MKLSFKHGYVLGILFFTNFLTAMTASERRSLLCFDPEKAAPTYNSINSDTEKEKQQKALFKKQIEEKIEAYFLNNNLSEANRVKLPAWFSDYDDENLQALLKQSNLKACVLEIFNSTDQEINLLMDKLIMFDSNGDLVSPKKDITKLENLFKKLDSRANNCGITLAVLAPFDIALCGGGAGFLALAWLGKFATFNLIFPLALVGGAATILTPAVLGGYMYYRHIKNKTNDLATCMSVNMLMPARKSKKMLVLLSKDQDVKYIYMKTN